MKKEAAYPSQQQDRFIVRLPDGMRDSLREAAEHNKRSMNAEIVARLQDYRRLYGLQPLLAFANAERESLKEELEKARARIAGLESTNSTEGVATPDEERTLYVLLDADGLPLSWPEIHAHLGEIGRAANLDIEKIDARIVDAKMVGSNEREQEWWDLIQKYRKARTNKAAGHDRD